jgi:hypothetical protein
MILIIIGSSQDLNMKHMVEKMTSYGPVVQGRLLTHYSGGDHDGGEGLRQGFPSPAGCREELQDPPDLASMTAAACSMFRRKVIRPLGFSHRGEYIGGRAASGGGPGGLTPWWCGPGVGCATLGWAWPLAPLRLIFELRDASGKIAGLAFVLSNSENISCVAFLKHKNSRKWGTGTVASR